LLRGLERAVDLVLEELAAPSPPDLRCPPLFLRRGAPLVATLQLEPAADPP